MGPSEHGDSSHRVPLLLQSFVRKGDRVKRLSEDGAAVLVRRATGGPNSRELVFARIGPVSSPRQRTGSSEWFIEGEVQSNGELKRMILSIECVKRHFYFGSAGDGRDYPYEVLAVDRYASVAELRLAWRVKTVAARLSSAVHLKAKVERAFNLLANSEVRAAYDGWLQDEDNPLPFPYAASGDCVVAGRLSKDGETFFADSILAYKPNVQPKRIEVLLRQCEFLPDRIIFKDFKRKVELWLDPGLLAGLAWDSTWNNCVLSASLRDEERAV
jgi:hypothetical protein